ncbi:hypothetical protein [Primorskyibacter flagellatus]|uniref:Uncharacterized protein n=1 Tax=Primorskyibacter flagellatus TaxID=1387277 RepID=A0A1W2EAW9_9RHOB|nr:hypothetical protein [Primorskyibacter flagellatus]SMD06903.1 hypothetical protein SAMN06295998_12549 [Primorskyibacter flagellatus]
MPKPKAQVLHPDTTGATLHIGDSKLLDQLGVSPAALPGRQAAPQEPQAKQPARQSGQASKPPRGSKPTSREKKMPSQSPQTHLHIAEKYLSEIEAHVVRTGVSKDDIIKLVAIELSVIDRFDMPDTEWIATRKTTKGVLIRYAIPQEFVDAYNRQFNPLGVKPQTHPYYAWADQHEDTVYPKILDRLKSI